MDSFDSSVGRAEDCSANDGILRSLVRVRLEGIFGSLFLLTVSFDRESNQQLKFPRITV